MAAPAGVPLEEALQVLDSYHRQIEGLSRQVALLQALVNETARARLALEGLEKASKDDVLVPLGAGAYIFARPQRAGTAVTGIGAGLSVERSWTEAVKGLAQREDELRQELQRMTDATVRLQQEAASLQDEIQAGMDMARASG